MGPAASLFAVGFVSLLGQVVLLRELVVASFGVELLYLLGTGLWLAAGAAGTAAGRGGSGRTAAAFLLLAVLLPAEIAFLRGARLLFGGVPGAYLPLGEQVAVAAAGLVPAGAALGWLFREAARASIAAGGTLAAAYGWECAGGALGSVASLVSVSLGVPNLAVGLSLSLVCAAAAAGSARDRRPALFLLPAIVLLLASSSGPADRAMTSWNHPGLADAADTPYGRIAVARAGGQVAVFECDALVYDSEGTEAEEFVRIAALQAPPRPRVLALGGGTAGIVEEVLRLDPVRVDYVEMDRRMYETLLPHLAPEVRRALARPPVRVVFADPRRFLASAGSYDLVLVAAPGPASGGTNRFYTREFFRLCAERLGPSGAAAWRLPSSENIWTAPLLRRNGSVHASLRASFRDVLVLPGSTDIFLAARGGLVRDPGELVRRLRERGGAGRLVTPEYVRYLLPNDRTAAAARLLAASEAPPNTDERPLCYQQTALLWLGMFLPSPDRAEPTFGTLGAGLLAAALVLLLLARRRPAARRAGVVFAAGFGGMVVEAVVLLRYQAESGCLYRDIGMLLTAFMAGLAAGAFAFDRRMAGRPVRRRHGAALLSGLILLCGALAAAAGTGGALFGRGPADAALFAAGSLVAAIFGYASRRGVEDEKAVVPLLYAADLLGGCAGSLLAGAVLIPLAGTAAPAGGTAVFLAAALLLL